MESKGEVEDHRREEGRRLEQPLKFTDSHNLQMLQERNSHEFGGSNVLLFLELLSGIPASTSGFTKKTDMCTKCILKNKHSSTQTSQFTLCSTGSGPKVSQNLGTITEYN